MFSEINIQELEPEEIERIANEIIAVFNRVAFSEETARGSPKEEVANCLFDHSEFYIDNQNILGSNNITSIVCLMNPIKDSRITQMARLVGITDNYAFQAIGTIEDGEPGFGPGFVALISTISVFPKDDFDEILVAAKKQADAEFLDCSIRHAFLACKMPPDVLISSIEKTVRSIPEVKAFLDSRRLTSIASQELGFEVQPRRRAFATL